MLTRDFIGQYISMGAGKKTKTLFYADDRVYWVVMSGQMKVSIDGVEQEDPAEGLLEADLIVVDGFLRRFRLGADHAGV